jgi:hypothetical protein
MSLETSFSFHFSILHFDRVTRLGEFSPIGRPFPLDSVLKNIEVHSPFLGGTFFHGQFKQKMGWATCWAIFSQTHLVTLHFDKNKLPLKT